jgi:hypothetical protein
VGSNRPAFTLGGEPVVELSAGTGDLRKRAGHRPLPVSRPLLFAGQLPLWLSHQFTHAEINEPEHLLFRIDTAVAFWPRDIPKATDR